MSVMARRRRKQLSRNMSGIIAGVVIAVMVIQCAVDARELENNTGYKGTVIPGAELMEVKCNPRQLNNVVDYKGFLVGFNPQMHVPNWVSWELTAEETKGATPRYNKFSSDPNVEGSAERWDYNYSGYDRGHMAPAGDMKWSEEVMKNTFYMTNICPQANSLNTGTWKRLEEKCRQWAQADSSIIIVCGPVLTDKITEFIGDSRVAVPERFFKVIYAPRSNRGIGFVMPNGSVTGGLQKAAMSIDEVEEITGHDFFSALPDSIEAIVETQNDFHYWTTLK